MQRKVFKSVMEGDNVKETLGRDGDSHIAHQLRLPINVRLLPHLGGYVSTTKSKEDSALDKNLFTYDRWPPASK